MTTLDVFAEIVPDERSCWRDAVRVGRVWKRRPDEHRGRLVRIRLDVPDRLLRESDLEVQVTVPNDPPKTVGGHLEVVA